jgi:hypothetical protein
MKTICKLIGARFISTMALAVLAIAVSLLSVPARADIVLSIEDVTGAPGSSGTFDVLLTNTGSASQNIAATNFELTTADTNITFNDVTTSTTTAPYIFPSSLFGPDIITFTTGQTIEAGDVDSTLVGTDVAPGAIYGLGNVSYSIAPGAVNGEVAEVDFVPYPNTSLSDNNFNNVPFTAESGTITVQTSTIPEPSAAIPLAGAVLLVACLSRRRRQSKVVKV